MITESQFKTCARAFFPDCIFEKGKNSTYDYNIINAKSLLNILSASIAKGARIELRCTGPNEEEDIERMMEVINNLEK